MEGRKNRAEKDQKYIVTVVGKMICLLSEKGPHFHSLRWRRSGGIFPIKRREDTEWMKSSLQEKWQKICDVAGGKQVTEFV